MTIDKDFNLPQEIIDAVEQWNSQGRDEEQVYGVINFLTGIGGQAIRKVIFESREKGYEHGQRKSKDSVYN